MIREIGQRGWGYKLFAERRPVEKVLLLSCAFGAGLWMIRVAFTGSLFHGFLLWNLFLAYIPYRITGYLGKTAGKLKSRFSFVLIFICWLLFIPNSFYIITDLFHLNEGTAAPQWYDLALIFSFAWNGLLLGILSLRKMEQLINAKLDSKGKWLFIYVIMWLNALGIYIGRYLRFNSWDVIADPFELAADIAYLCIHPFRNFQEWGMIACFSVLMTLIYKSITTIGKEFFQ